MFNTKIMELTSIAKKNLVDEAYAQILQMIMNGVWKEGECIPSENQLCKDLGVSRVVVREVLQRLRAQKMIVTRQGVGSFVSNPNNFEPLVSGQTAPVLSEKRFTEVMEFRRAVEYELIKLAVERGTEEDLEKIRQAVDEMAENKEDVEKFTNADLKFHHMICKAAHSELLCKAWESCMQELYACFLQMNSVSDVLAWGVEMHRNIYDGIAARNAKKAVQALKNGSEYNHARLGDIFTSA